MLYFLGVTTGLPPVTLQDGTCAGWMLFKKIESSTRKISKNCEREILARSFVQITRDRGGPGRSAAWRPDASDPLCRFPQVTGHLQQYLRRISLRWFPSLTLPCPLFFPKISKNCEREILARSFVRDRGGPGRSAAWRPDASDPLCRFPQVTGHLQQYLRRISLRWFPSLTLPCPLFFPKISKNCERENLADLFVRGNNEKTTRHDAVPCAENT